MQIVTEDVSTKSKAQHHKLLYCCLLFPKREEATDSKEFCFKAVTEGAATIEEECTTVGPTAPTSGKSIDLIYSIR